MQLAENFEIPSELFVEGFVNQAVLIVGDAEELIGAIADEHFAQIVVRVGID